MLAAPQRKFDDATNLADSLEDVYRLFCRETLSEWLWQVGKTLSHPD